MQNTNVTDGELLKQWTHLRSEGAFRALVARHLEFVHSAARRVCGDESVASDIAQLTFITLARKSAVLADRSSIAGWLHITAVMHTKNLMRHRRRESVKLERFHRSIPDPTTMTASNLWLDLHPHLDAASAKLSAPDREALLLRYYRSFTVNEIASSLGVATAAAQKRLDRATKRLRKELGFEKTGAAGILGRALQIGFELPSNTHSMSGVGEIASQAITLAEATTIPSLTKICIYLMTKKSIIIAASIIILVGGGVYIKNRTAKNPNDLSLSQPSASKSNSRSSAENGDTKSNASLTRKERSKIDLDPELVATYGEARTKLAKQVAAEMIGLQQDTLKMMNFTMSVADANSSARDAIKKDMLEAHLRGAGLALSKLDLSEEQQSRLVEIGEEAQKRNLEKMTQITENLERNPKAVTEFLLAGDAFSRNEIAEEEYLSIAESKDQETGGALYKDGLKSNQSYLDDPLFQQGFLENLNPEQASVLQNVIEKRRLERERRPTLDASATGLAKQNEEITRTRKLFGNMMEMLEKSKENLELLPKSETK